MELHGVDLNLLLGLDALLSEQNVTRAAARLSVGQSAMSATLGRLRRHFDDPLLVREGSALRPTPLAEALAPLVEEAVQSARAVFTTPRGFDPRTERRSFTIVASDYVTLVLLRPLIARLATEAPLQRINVTWPQTDFFDHLRIGRADAVILPAEIVPAGTVVAHQHLFADRFVLIADHDHDLHGAVTPERFSELPYIAFDGGPHRSVPDGQLEAFGVARRVEMSLHSYVVMPFMVVGTDLVALIPELLLGHLAVQPHLRVAEPPAPMRPLSETLLWSPRQTDDPGHTWLRQQLAQQAASIEHPRRS